MIEKGYIHKDEFGLASKLYLQVHKFVYKYSRVIFKIQDL